MTTSAPTTDETTPATSSGHPPLWRSPWLPRLLTPVLAVVPWTVTLAAVVKVDAWTLPGPGESQTDLMMSATVLFLLAAVLWAALTAWSSAGAGLAGAATLVLAWFVSTIEGQTSVIELGMGLGVYEPVWTVLTAARPDVLLLLGALLSALCLSAAGARRWGRRRPVGG